MDSDDCDIPNFEPSSHAPENEQPAVFPTGYLDEDENAKSSDEESFYGFSSSSGSESSEVSDESIISDEEPETNKTKKSAAEKALPGIIDMADTTLVQWCTLSEWSDKRKEFELPDFTESPGANYCIPNIEDSSALDFFQLFFTASIQKRIVTETIRYAHQSKAFWFYFTVEELRAYLGINVIMGFNILPAIYDYWSGERFLGVQAIKDIMPRDRFMIISKFLHLRDNKKAPKKGEPEYDKIYKVRNIFDKINKYFLRVYTPEKELAIDEGMIKFRGRISFKQYMPKKPIKHGIKVWMIAESKSGYVSNMEIYLGKNKETDQRETGLGRKIVLRLSRPFWYENRHLYFDNYFNSPSLQKSLLKRETFSCGTQLTNRKTFPTDLKKPKKLKRGEIRVRQKGPLVATQWRDKRVVTMLSTSHTIPAQEVYFVGRDLPSGKPDVIKSYNLFMGGVDKNDQLRSYYTAGRPAKKWWKYIFWFLFNVSMVNASILLNLSDSKTNYSSQLEFRKALATQLIGGFTSRKSRVKRNLSSIADDAGPFSNHKCIRSEGSKANCYNCKRKGKKTLSGLYIRTVYICSHCNVRLCRETCFAEHHAENSNTN